MTPHHEIGRFRHRGGAWIAVAAVHTLLILAMLMSGPLQPHLRQPEPMFASIRAVTQPEQSVQPTLAAPSLAPTDRIVMPLIPVQTDVVVAFAAESSAMPVQGETAVAVAVAVPTANTAPLVIPPESIAYLVRPPPEYPRASRRLHEQGRVIVRVLVDEDGMPRQVQVSASSGYPRLDDAALLAVQKYRFKPYVDHGQPTAGWALIPFDFDLDS